MANQKAPSGGGGTPPKKALPRVGGAQKISRPMTRLQANTAAVMRSSIPQSQKKQVAKYAMGILRTETRAGAPFRPSPTLGKTRYTSGAAQFKGGVSQVLKQDRGGVYASMQKGERNMVAAFKAATPAQKAKYSRILGKRIKKLSG